MSRIKRIQNPTFRDSEMIIENPVLLLGEIVFIISESTTEIINYKVGDGINGYVNLPFKDIATYPYNDLVTNPIGDLTVGENLNGELLVDVIKDMVSPYIASAVSNVQTNADGQYKNVAIMEVGLSLGSAIGVAFDVSNEENLVAIPMEVLASDFVVSNPYPNAGISLTPNGVLNPTSPVTYSIQVRAIHTNGTSAYAIATIRFDARLIWGASALSNLTTNQHALDLIANGGDQGLQNVPVGEYEIGVAGYGYVLVPSFFIDPLTWTEISDPNAPASIGMINMGTLSVNNGFGTYNYEKYRTPFSNLESVKLKAS